MALPVLSSRVNETGEHDVNRNTEAAIRHMRGKRQQIVQRRRRRHVMAGVGALALALSAAVGVAGLTGTDLADAAATRARSIMDLMDQRSPGARTTAELTKTKARHMILPEREAAAPSLPENLAHILAPVPTLVPVDLGPPAIPELTLLSPPPLPPVFFAPPPGGGVGACCGGGGGGGGGGGTDSPPPPPPGVPSVPPPVPEPSTWMTMLLGFGLMGWLLRRERAVTLVPVRA